MELRSATNCRGLRLAGSRRASSNQVRSEQMRGDEDLLSFIIFAFVPI
jgi:hypothetical protein